MGYVEPSLIKIEVAGEQFTPVIDDENPIKVRDWDDRYNWALNKIVGDDFERIDAERISDEIKAKIEEIFSPVFSIDNGIAEQLRRRATREIHLRGEQNIVLYKDEVIVIIASSPGLMYVVSEYKKDVHDIISSFNGRISNFSSIASDFGLNVELLHGEAFAQNMAKELTAEVVSRDEFDNTAEQTIFSEVSDRITTSIDSNVELRFGEDEPETYEYDLVIYAGPNHRIVVEVKDASHEDADLDRGDLIDTPRDKTNILKPDQDEGVPPGFGPTDKTEAFVIVKQMSEDSYIEQKKKANRRDITLLKYESGSYINELESMFESMCI